MTGARVLALDLGVHGVPRPHLERQFGHLRELLTP
jgi:hypothetical protein